MSEKGDSSTMICVSTYGDGVDSKMEAEDTKYVIDELKKSRESLQNYNRYKVDADKSLLPKVVQTESVLFSEEANPKGAEFVRLAEKQCSTIIGENVLPCETCRLFWRNARC